MISKNDNTKEWRVVSLGAVTTKIGSGATPRGGAEAYKKEGISLIRSQNVLDFDFSYRGLAFIDEQQAKKLSNVSVEENDVLINITGDSVARVCMVPAKVIPARVNQHVAIIRASKTKLDSYYLLYYLLNTYFKKHLLKLASDGATRNALTKSDIEGLSINLPPLPEQKAIAKVLTAFDDKIELLQSQNKTLESMAQTIFKEWFGKYQIGDELPEGWRLGNIGKSDFCKILGSGINSFEGEKTYIATADVTNSDITNTNTKINFTNRPSRANMQPVGYSIWFAKMQDSRKLIIVDQNSHKKIDKMIFSTGFAGIKTTKLSHYYMSCFILSKEFDSIKNNLANGAVQISINNTNIKSIEIIIPDKEILNRFNKITKHLFQKISNNKSKIETLTKTRDTLLPKLMSGQVRVNNLNEKSNIVSGDLIEGAEGTIPNNIVDDGPKINLF